MTENSTTGTTRLPALEALANEISWIYLDAGRPSYRTVATALAEADEKAPSHTAVGKVLRCAELPRWRYVELIVRYLGSTRGKDRATLDTDVERVRSLWAAASDPAAVARRSATSPATPAILSGGVLLPHRPDELDRNCVLPLALDDQWMPRDFLRRMAVEGATTADVESDRLGMMQRELIRSLITAKRVVINRAFLFRNDVVTRSYTTDGARAAFADLVREKAILIFLINERDPLESDYAKGTAAEPAARAWAGIAKSVDVGCVRFHWDGEEENRRLTREWHRDFERRIRLTATIRGDRLLALLADVRAPRADPGRLETQLDDISRRSLPDGPVPISRSKLYREFVVREAKDIDIRRYDFAKPNMIALKWLFDLVYNSNLATRLGVALAGPADSVHRSMVHSPHFLQDEPGDRADLARVRCALMEIIQDAVFRHEYSAGALRLFDGVTLQQVVEIRGSEPWRRYTEAVDMLLKEPWLLAHPERGLRNVLQRYDELLSTVGGLS
jgi:hypothetical protein